jgi:hypothetical protein
MPERAYHWLAIRGAAVVPAPAYMEVTRAQMVQARIRIGSSPGESSIWSRPGTEDAGRGNDILDRLVPDDRPPHYLIGYKTAAARQASFKLLLHAPFNVAEKEFNRAAREEVIIRGPKPTAQ